MRLRILALAALAALGGCASPIISNCRPAIVLKLSNEGIVEYEGQFYTLEAIGPSLNKNYRGQRDCYVGVLSSREAKDAYGLKLAQYLAGSGFKTTEITAEDKLY